MLNLSPINVLTTTAGAPSLGLPFLNTNNLVGLQYVGELKLTVNFGAVR